MSDVSQKAESGLGYLEIAKEEDQQRGLAFWADEEGLRRYSMSRTACKKCSWVRSCRYRRTWLSPGSIWSYGR